MKDVDTIAMVTTFFLVLPWLARLVVSAKATWRALNGRQGYEKNETR